MVSRILFVDDERSILNSLKRLTRELDAECIFVSSGHEALELFEQEPFDIVVSDMKMPEMDGSILLAEIALRYPECLRMVLSGYSEQENVLAAINKGRIWGFIDKPWDDSQLLATLSHAMNTQQLIAERALLRRTVEKYEREYKTGFSDFVGSSMPMQFVYNSIERAAPSVASVFITGPSGTGKELAAQAIHEHSTRKDAAFIALNCAAIPKDLMESEIFGHVKGAFSSAVSNRDGAATLANKGTLFLDELTEMDISLQAKLLRFIQTGSFQKVGSGKTEVVDIRFVCACNRPPLNAIADNLLREDLYYRLNVISISMPPLNERGEDVVDLATYFLSTFARLENKTFGGFSKNAKGLLTSYSWPGNVRQLENCIHSIVIMCEGPLITADMMLKPLGLSAEDLSELSESDLDGTAKHRGVDQKEEQGASTQLASESTNAGSTENLDIIQPLSLVEKGAIESAVRLCNGNVVKAASALEVSPSTLYRKIQQWEKLPVSPSE